jgi:hypothetical protein
LENVPVAGTVLVLQALAEPRGLRRRALLANSFPEPQLLSAKCNRQNDRTVSGSLDAKVAGIERVSWPLSASNVP